MTTKSTGVNNTRQLSQLKAAILLSICEFISTHSTLNGFDFFNEIKVNLPKLCPLPAEHWEHNNHGGLRITAFTKHFSEETKRKLINNPNNLTGCAVEWEHEQITAGINTY